MTAVSSKVSSCVDCATPIIGARLRCPACRDQHALKTAGSDEDATVPRARTQRRSSIGAHLPRLLAAAEFLFVVAIFLLFAGKACR